MVMTVMLVVVMALVAVVMPGMSVVVVALMAVVVPGMSVVVMALVAMVMTVMLVVVMALVAMAMFGCHNDTAPLHRDGRPGTPGRRPSSVTGYQPALQHCLLRLCCVWCVVRVVRVRAVLLTVLVAVLGTVLVELLAPTEGHAGLVAVDVAVTCAVLVAVHLAVAVAVLALVLVAVVSRFRVVVNLSGHLSSFEFRFLNQPWIREKLFTRTGASVNTVRETDTALRYHIAKSHFQGTIPAKAGVAASQRLFRASLGAAAHR